MYVYQHAYRIQGTIQFIAMLSLHLISYMKYIDVIFKGALDCRDQASECSYSSTPIQNSNEIAEVPMLPEVDESSIGTFTCSTSDVSFGQPAYDDMALDQPIANLQVNINMHT